MSCISDFRSNPFRVKVQGSQPQQMAKTSNETPKKFERVPRVTRSKAAAAAAVADIATSRKRKGPDAIKVTASSTVVETAHQVAKSVSAATTSKASKTSSPDLRPPTDKSAIPTSGPASSPPLAVPIPSGRLPSSATSSGIQVTTADLLQVNNRTAESGESAVKVEAVIDMAIPPTISVALEELLAGQQCLSELEKVAAGDTNGHGLSQLLRAATTTSTPAAPEKAVTTTGEMGLTLLAQAAAQEEKTGDTEALASMNQLTSSGFALPENPVVYQQTAVGCLPEATVENCVSYTPGSGVASWTDTTADLGQYSNWFANLATGMNPAHVVPHVQLTQEHLQMPVSLPGIDTLTHPHMLLFDTLSAATVQHSQPIDMQTHLTSMAGLQRPTPSVPEATVPVASEPSAVPLNGEDTRSDGTAQEAQPASLRESKEKTATMMNGNVYQQPKCAYCDLRFQTRTIRDQHARECPSNPYKCPTCSKACLGTVKLQRHIRSHLRSRTSSEIEDAERKANAGPDPKCAYCNVRFPSRVVRDRHSRMCGKNPYQCKLCNKAFLGTAKLTRHMRCHTAPEGSKAHAQLQHLTSKDSQQSSDSSASSSPGSTNSECNDIGIEENTDQPQAGDALQGALLPMPSSSSSSSLASIQDMQGAASAININITSSINITSEGLAVPCAVQLGDIDATGLPIHSVGEPIASSQSSDSTFNDSSTYVQASVPPTVPMMVAMPLLSCW